MKTFVVRAYQDGEIRSLRVEADGYVVGPSGEVHFLKERFGQPPQPFLVLADGQWEMVAIVEPPYPVALGLDTPATIEEASN
jgi:hypothetical protein